MCFIASTFLSTVHQIQGSHENWTLFSAGSAEVGNLGTKNFLTVFSNATNLWTQSKVPTTWPQFSICSPRGGQLNLVGWKKSAAKIATAQNWNPWPIRITSTTTPQKTRFYINCWLNSVKAFDVCRKANSKFVWPVISVQRTTAWFLRQNGRRQLSLLQYCWHFTLSTMISTSFWGAERKTLL